MGKNSTVYHSGIFSLGMGNQNSDTVQGAMARPQPDRASGYRYHLYHSGDSTPFYQRKALENKIMKKIFIIITLAAIFPISGCASFRQIDTTDVIPNKNQINAQLSAEKAKEKAYSATKGTYPDTMVQPVNTSTTATTTPATTTVQPLKPVKIVDVMPSSTTPVTTTTVPVSSTPVATVTTTPVASTPAVIISSTAKKPTREIIIYPDDTPVQDVTVKPASGTQVIKITPTASKATTAVSASKTPVVAIIPADTTTTETIYKVLVGKFPTKDAVEPLLAELKETYKEAFIKKNEGKEEYSVQIAASTNEKATNILVAKLKEKGYKVFVLTVKK